MARQTFVVDGVTCTFRNPGDRAHVILQREGYPDGFIIDLSTVGKIVQHALDYEWTEGVDKP